MGGDVKAGDSIRPWNSRRMRSWHRSFGFLPKRILPVIVATASFSLAAAQVNSSHRPGGAISPQLVSIRSILNSVAETEPKPVLLRGAVINFGDTLTIQDQTGGIEVFPQIPIRLALGDEVEVHGEYVRRDGLRVVQHAKVDRLWAGSPPLPLAMTPDLAAEGEYSCYLVQVEGVLRRQEQLRDGASLLVLEGSHQFFSAQLAAGAAFRMLATKLENTSRLRLTGVLAVRENQYGMQSGSFTLLIRSPDDVQVVKEAPWWTPVHMAWLALALPFFAVVVYVVRTRGMRLRFTAVLAERGRIARDIHDTLAQGFAGIAFQLEGAQQEVDRDHALAKKHLSIALSMVRYSRAEAHRSIAALRAFSQDQPLYEALCEMGRLANCGTQMRIQVSTTGTPFPIPGVIADQLYRIAQESMSNALQHANASLIEVRLDYLRQELGLSVCDDGCGFVLDAVHGPETGHFGLVGIRERTVKLRGSFKISSTSRGTQSEVRVPVSASVSLSHLSVKKFLARLRRISLQRAMTAS